MIGSVGGPGILLPILAMRRDWRYTCNNAKLIVAKINGSINGNEYPPAVRTDSPARCSTSKLIWPKPYNTDRLSKYSRYSKFQLTHLAREHTRNSAVENDCKTIYTKLAEPIRLTCFYIISQWQSPWIIIFALNSSATNLKRMNLSNINWICKMSLELEITVQHECQ